MGLFKTRVDENWKINYIKEFNEMRSEYEKKILSKQNEIDDLKKQLEELKCFRSNLRPKEKQIKDSDIESIKELRTQGLSYKEYCQILIAVQNTGDSLYRIMDLIQINIQKRYNSEFLMSKSLTGFKLKATYETAPLFTAIPIVVNNLTEENNAYKYSMAYYDSY